MKALQFYVYASLLLYTIGCTNKETWVLFKDESKTTLSFNKSQSKSINNYTFKATWDNQLSYSDNIGMYGGIKKLEIHKDEKRIQTLKKIEDAQAIGQINFTFYDYNFDGHIDFSIPINCGKSCKDIYYLYDPNQQIFIHQPSWDDLTIQKVDTIQKLILSQPDGNALNDEQEKFKIEGMMLEEITP